MKNIIYVISLGLIISLFGSCKKENTQDSNNNSRLTPSISLRTNGLTDEEENIRIILCESQINFNNSVAEFYANGISFEQFCINAGVDSNKIMPEGVEILKVAYACLINNATENYIYENYSGEQMYNGMLASKIFNSENSTNGSEIFGFSPDKAVSCEHWYDLACQGARFVAWVQEVDWEKVYKAAEWISNIGKIFGL